MGSGVRKCEEMSLQGYLSVKITLTNFIHLTTSPLRALFSNWDVDGNGVLSIEEVREQLRDLGAGMAAAEEDAEALMLLAMEEEGAHGSTSVGVSGRGDGDLRPPQQVPSGTSVAAGGGVREGIVGKAMPQGISGHNGLGSSSDEDASPSSPDPGAALHKRGITLHEFSRFVRKVSHHMLILPAPWRLLDWKNVE